MLRMAVLNARKLIARISVPRSLNLCSALFCFLHLYACGQGDGGGGFLVEEVNKKSFFYRVEASFTVLETGEEIKFDYVAGCGVKTTWWRASGRSEHSEMSPQNMILPTSNGAAILLRTLNLCLGLGQYIGDDFLPLAIWFDDVNDLSFGWGYSSVEAYQRENAKMAFNGVTYSNATHDEWAEWWRSAEESFEPIGMLPGPWGYDHYGIAHDPQIRAMKARFDGRTIGARCLGLMRIPLPDEVMEYVEANWPRALEGKRYQAISGWGGQKIEGLSEVLYAATFEDGREMIDYDKEYSLAGHINRSGPAGSRLRQRYDVNPLILEIFPVLPRSRSTIPMIIEPADAYPQRALIGPEWRGLTACGGYEPVDRNMFGGRTSLETYGEPPFDPEFRTKKFPFYINDDLVYEEGSPYQAPNIIDRVERAMYREAG
ncbi:hypothetical protein [Hyphococcus sp.]|uniref:hypothetical protein n=1 Tax=Hyphococcus sp. TaxID=2038636 RepID=UPI002081302C|nr:MAG: hypothetical protein DHS20C04_19050 [Marinicaulis sp.]